MILVGCFVVEFGCNLNGEDVVWVDYDVVVLMYWVRVSKLSEWWLE